MKFRFKEILFCLLILFSISVVKSQEPTASPTPPIVVDEDNVGCVLPEIPLVQLEVSVWSSKKGDIKDLIYKDFKVYDENELREIEFFKFDEAKNQYVIGFSQKDYMPDNKWHDIKVKVKLSTEKRKNYGKISVKAQNGYYSGNPKSKI